MFMFYSMTICSICRIPVERGDGRALPVRQYVDGA